METAVFVTVNFIKGVNRSQLLQPFAKSPATENITAASFEVPDPLLEAARKLIGQLAKEKISK